MKNNEKFKLKANRINKKNNLKTWFSNEIINYPVSANLIYIFSVGSVLGIYFVLQIFAGIFLAMHYAPDLVSANEFTQYIMANVKISSNIHLINMNGALIILICIWTITMIISFSGIITISYKILQLDIVISKIGYIILIYSYDGIKYCYEIVRINYQLIIIMICEGQCGRYIKKNRRPIFFIIILVIIILILIVFIKSTRYESENHIKIFDFSKIENWLYEKIQNRKKVVGRPIIFSEEMRNFARISMFPPKVKLHFINFDKTILCLWDINPWPYKTNLQLIPFNEIIQNRNKFPHETNLRFIPFDETIRFLINQSQLPLKINPNVIYFNQKINSILSQNTLPFEGHWRRSSVVQKLFYRLGIDIRPNNNLSEFTIRRANWIWRNSQIIGSYGQMFRDMLPKDTENRFNLAYYQQILKIDIGVDNPRLRHERYFKGYNDHWLNYQTWCHNNDMARYFRSPQRERVYDQWQPFFKCLYKILTTKPPTDLKRDYFTAIFEGSKVVNKFSNYPTNYISIRPLFNNPSDEIIARQLYFTIINQIDIQKYGEGIDLVGVPNKSDFEYHWERAAEDSKTLRSSFFEQRVKCAHAFMGNKVIMDLEHHEDIKKVLFNSAQKSAVKYHTDLQNTWKQCQPSYMAHLERNGLNYDENAKSMLLHEIFAHQVGTLYNIIIGHSEDPNFDLVEPASMLIGASEYPIGKDLFSLNEFKYPPEIKCVEYDWEDRRINKNIYWKFEESIEEDVE